MNNPYTRNINRIEFVVTLACTGRCKHCSEGEHTSIGGHIDGDVAADMVKRVAANYNIQSLMTFGGEPLLWVDDVYKIHAAAREMGIPKRQLITNGFFPKDTAKISEAARGLVESGVNDILLSVDAFHQETIPIEPVIEFAKALKEEDVRLRVHPAWLISEEDNNSYNVKTRELLSVFTKMGIPVSDGNVIFPNGNALKYLSEYFDKDKEYISPYHEDPKDVHTISVNPDGTTMGGNIYQKDIMEIIQDYTV